MLLGSWRTVRVSTIELLDSLLGVLGILVSNKSSAERSSSAVVTQLESDDLANSLKELLYGVNIIKYEITR